MSTFIKYLQLYLHLLDADGKPVRRRIGYLSAYGDILRVSFDPSFSADPDRPTLSQAYRGVDESATRAILGAQRDERVVRSDGHWPNYFSNLLPESDNRKRLARERGCSEDDDFELLAAAGHDLMGAVEVEPVDTGEEIPEAVRSWHTSMGLDVLEPGFVEWPTEDGAAIPGVVTKFSAVKEGHQYVVHRHGAAGSYIIKLPSTKHPDLVENEFTGYRLCQALKLDCAEAEIIDRSATDLPEEIEFPHLLAVKRFDRENIFLNDKQYVVRRIHFEEFCQALNRPPLGKYGKDMIKDYAEVAFALDKLSGDAVADLSEYIRRFVAFVLMGNCDAHLKNWGLIYQDSVTPRLAKLYDPVCVAAFFDDANPNEYAHNRAIDNKLRVLEWRGLEDMLTLAQLSTRRIGQLRRAARDVVLQAKAEWPALLKDAPDSVRATVMQRLAGGVALANMA